MRLIKVLGLAALTVLAAMALVGASSALATGTTALCKSNEEVCSESKLVSSIHEVLTTGTIVSLLNDLVTVLCLGLLLNAKSLQVGIPQKINSEEVTFTGCGTGSAHNNCTLQVKELPKFTLLKTASNLGVLTATNGKLLLECIGLKCTYLTSSAEFGVEGALHQGGTGNGMFTAAGTEFTSEESNPFLCFQEVKLDSLLEPLEHAYVAGIANQATALCKVHEEPCKEANLVKTLHISTADPSLLVPYEEEVRAVACKSSSVSAAVGPLGAPQEISIEEFTWTGCKIGSDSCTVETIKLGTLYLYRTGLNVGSAIGTDNEFEVSCTKPNFTCTFAGEPKLAVEGAEHTGGAGYGMFSATASELDPTEGECEGPATLHGLFEPLTNVHVTS